MYLFKRKLGTGSLVLHVLCIILVLLTPVALKPEYFGRTKTKVSITTDDALAPHVTRSSVRMVSTVELTGPCFPWEMISTTCAISMFKDDRKSWYTLEIPQIKSAWLGLILNGLIQERRNSIANTLELRLSCTNPSYCSWSSADLTLP